MVDLTPFVRRLYAEALATKAMTEASIRVARRRGKEIPKEVVSAHARAVEDLRVLGRLFMLADHVPPLEAGDFGGPTCPGARLT